MSTKKTTSTSQTSPVPDRQPAAHHRLDALLHTMRSIGQYEDVLCELTHEIRRTGVLSSETSRELRELLEKIPAHDLVLDLDALQAILVESQPSTTPGRKSSK